MKNSNIKDIIYIALFAALISALGYVSIPLPFSPVPLTGQTFGIMLAGLLLTPKKSSLSVLVWILIGSIGVPVFAGGRAGLNVVTGPTGGYILGFVLGAAVIGLIIGKNPTLSRMYLGTFIGGILVIHALGFTWLASSLNIPLKEAFLLGTLPYLIGDVIKMIISVPLAKRLRRHVTI